MRSRIVPRDWWLPVLLMLVLAATGYNVYQGRANADRITSTQNGIASTAHTTCVVQARGLSATPFLVDAMRDIATLITAPPGKVPAGMERQFRIAADLHDNLLRYVGIQEQQPRHRNCGP